MRTLRAPSRMALQTASALAAALLIASGAAAQVATPTVASDMCSYASNKPPLLTAALRARFQSAGFTGLAPSQCNKFVNGLVKDCLSIVKIGTKCTLNANKTVAKMSAFDCDAQPTRDDQKSCKQSNKSDLKNDQANAMQPVQLQGNRACELGFAAVMTEICLEGVPPP